MLTDAVPCNAALCAVLCCAMLCYAMYAVLCYYAVLRPRGKTPGCICGWWTQYQSVSVYCRLGQYRVSMAEQLFYNAWYSSRQLHS